MLPRQGKPIALLTDKQGTAVTWVMNHHDVVEYYSTSDRRIVAGGQEYVICWTKEQLDAVEISDYKDVGGNSRPSSFFIELAEHAKTRIK